MVAKADLNGRLEVGKAMVEKEARREEKAKAIAGHAALRNTRLRIARRKVRRAQEKARGMAIATIVANQDTLPGSVGRREGHWQMLRLILVERLRSPRQNHRLDL